MYVTEYVLSIAELLHAEPAKREALESLILSKIDQNRKNSALRIRNAGKRAQSLGAGLLLQAAYRDFLCGEKHTERHVYSLSELADQTFTPAELSYTYGPNGKPYFKDVPLYFSLSHSGEYVYLAVSDEEIGADIQKMKNDRRIIHEVAGRYFTEKERAALGVFPDEEKERQDLTDAVSEEKEHLAPACLTDEERTQVFYRLWCCKEAYGKLTGEGLKAALNVDLTGAFACFKVDFTPEGYCTALCRRKINEEITDLPEGL